MSSDLQSAVEALMQNNYLAVVACTIVGYDYILTFSREIEYIWYRKWTWVSTVFIIARYPGLCWAMLNGLVGTSFVPGPLQVSLPAQRPNVAWAFAGTVLLLVSCWTFPLFICASDLLMVLRVYAMWNRSRIILYFLLFIYVSQVIVSVVLPAIYNSSTTYFNALTVQIYDFTVCGGTFTGVPVLLGVYNALPRFTLSAVLLVLAVFRTLKQMLEMYNATKQWQPNRYMNQFARDGILYFTINTVYNIVVTIGASPTVIVASNLAFNVLVTLTSSLLCSMMPRFIISMRELFEGDHRGHSPGIDSGFGITSRREKRSTSSTTLTSAWNIGQEGSLTLQGESGDIDHDSAGAIPLNDVEASAPQV